MGRAETPLDPDGPVAVFALALRALRDHAAQPVKEVPDIAKRQGVSESALYAATRGRVLPSPATLSVLVHAWGGDQQEWHLRRRQAESERAAAALPRSTRRGEPPSNRSTTAELRTTTSTSGGRAAAPEVPPSSVATWPSDLIDIEEATDLLDRIVRASGRAVVHDSNSLLRLLAVRDGRFNVKSSPSAATPGIANALLDHAVRTGRVQVERRGRHVLILPFAEGLSIDRDTTNGPTATPNRPANRGARASLPAPMHYQLSVLEQLIGDLRARGLRELTYESLAGLLSLGPSVRDGYDPAYEPLTVASLEPALNAALSSGRLTLLGEVFDLSHW